MILISNTFLFAGIDGLNYLIATILGQATDSQMNDFGHYLEQEENKYVIVLPENKPPASGNLCLWDLWAYWP